MVSTHKVPVVVYLIIKVICFAFRFKRDIERIAKALGIQVTVEIV